MTTAKTAQLVLTDTEKTIRHRDKDAPKSSPRNAPVLFLAFDGVNRDLLYDMLEKGEMPKLTDLLSGEGDKYPHAYFDPSLLSTMPSSTMAAWTTVLTGVPPGVHGVAGNEFFIREENRLGAPAPVSFTDSEPTIEIYTDGYLNKLVKVPTVYERMRAREPHIAIWVALHQLYSGADRLLFATNTVMARALEEGLIKVTKKTTKTATLQDDDKPDRNMFAMLDDDVIEEVVDALDDEDDAVPDVLTVYLTGTDLYAHVAEEGPDQARRAYLHEVVDPALGKLSAKLRERDALSDRWVVITSDHGHTPVRHDEKHALYTEGDDSPARLISRAGYRLRPSRKRSIKTRGSIPCWPKAALPPSSIWPIARPAQSPSGLVTGRSRPVTAKTCCPSPRRFSRTTAWVSWCQRSKARSIWCSRGSPNRTERTIYRSKFTSAVVGPCRWGPTWSNTPTRPTSTRRRACAISPQAYAASERAISCC